MQGGGGPVCVLRHDQTGKLSSPPTISGHKGQVLDMAFSPFNAGMLATGSDECANAPRHHRRKGHERGEKRNDRHYVAPQ